MNTKRLAISLLSTLVFGVHLALAAGTPNNVTGLEATAIDDSSIGLTWDSTIDAEGNLVDHYRIYYGTFSVFEAGSGDYENEIDTPNNNASYVVSGLDANTAYYFSVTGISSDDLESEEYSFEANATTLAAEEGEEEGGEEADTTAPKVSSVSAPDSTHVQVVFSEAVALPSESAEAAFSIIEQINTENTLTVVSAVMDESDAENKTVLLETSEQTADVNYIVTAGVAIKDLADNPIVSGSTDSGLFLGSGTAAAGAEEEDGGEEEAAEGEEGAGEGEEAAPAEDCEADLDCFVAHLADCSAAKATATAEDDTHKYSIEITADNVTDCTVTFTADEHPSILFAGEQMECPVPKGSFTAEQFRDAIDPVSCSGTLANGYSAIEVKDTTPPEDVTNLSLTFKKLLEEGVAEELAKFMVIMNWTASIDSAKDLVDQVLYMSLDRGNTYDAGQSLGDSATSHEVSDLEGGKEYTFKVTTKDAAGNESTGAIKSIRLPSTGAGVGLAMLAGLLGANRVLRRRD